MGSFPVVNFSTARALEADVDALETGWRGRELRNGGDFFGNGSDMYAASRGEVTFLPELPW